MTSLQHSASRASRGYTPKFYHISDDFPVLKLHLATVFRRDVQHLLVAARGHAVPLPRVRAGRDAPRRRHHDGDAARHEGRAR